MKVACVQPRAFDLYQFKEALAHMLNMIDEAAKQSPHLIVVPECAYPSYYLGSSEEHLNDAMNLVDQAIELIKLKALTYGTYIAFGIVVKENEKLFNRGILVNPIGELVGHVNKSFMWHFDSDWFSTEQSANIVDTPHGKWGLIICADGRMPELVRNLALQGVNLIIDLANLTSTGKFKDQLTNAQSGFILSTRALENNVWLVMADKVGVEARTVTYSGRSSIISPAGEIVAEASPHQEEIIYADIHPTSKRGNLLDLRRTSTYKSLFTPISELPISNTYKREIVPSNLVIQGSSVQFFYGNKEEYLHQAQYFIQTLENQLTDVIVLPHFSEEVVSPFEIQRFIQNEETNVFYSSIEQTDYKNSITLFIVTKNGVRKYHKTHLTSEEKEQFTPGNHYKVIETAKGNIGVMLGEDGLYPEVARILTLQGADCIVWINELLPSVQEKVARTRAAENKIFVLTSNQVNKWSTASSLIIDPNGNIIAATLQDKDQACSTQVPLVLSRCKAIVPKTNAIFDRKPNEYKLLTMEKGTVL